MKRKTQQFNRGDVVMCDQSACRGYGPAGKALPIEAVVVGSYSDLFGISPYNTEQYEIMFLHDGNTLAWLYPDQLKYLRRGGENLIHKVQLRRTTTATARTF